MLFIRLLGHSSPLLLLSDNDTCPCKVCFYEIIISRAFLINLALLKLEHKPSDRRRVETVDLLTVSWTK